MEFKIGQKVVCIDNPKRRKGDQCNDGRGYGWELGKILEISEIGIQNPCFGNQRILWVNVKSEIFGVFEDNVVVAGWDIQKKLE